MAFSDPKMYDKLYNLKNFGIRGEELVVSVGANAKMNEFSAVMGLCNLKHIDSAIEARKERYDYYIELLKDVAGISFFDRNPEATNNYAYFPILIEPEYGKSRDEFYDYLKANNVYCRKYFYPITADQACFRNKYRNDDLQNARKLAEKVVSMPIYDELSFRFIQNIIDCIKKIE